MLPLFLAFLNSFLFPFFLAFLCLLLWRLAMFMLASYQCCSHVLLRPMLLVARFEVGVSESWTRLYDVERDFDELDLNWKSFIPKLRVVTR